MADSANSAIAGYIRENPGAISRAELESVVRGMLVGLTGLAEELVRPLYRHEPAEDPPPPVNWCAFDIRGENGRNFPEVRHISSGDGHDKVISQDDKEIYLRFWGPQADDLAGLVRRGLHIEQNRFPMRQAGIAVRSVGAETPTAELEGGKWLRRVELSIRVTLESIGVYDVFNLVRAVGSIVAGDGNTEFDTNNKG